MKVNNNFNTIPKVIHYCWFGRSELPALAVKCINSWKKFCPDYEIKEWNETNFDVNSCEYVKHAYVEKKWAFVSDYARFWILYNEGGIYFDTDVELIRPIDDILKEGAFMGCEPTWEGNRKNSMLKIAPGLGIAAPPKHEIYKEIIDFYEKRNFYQEDGGIDFTTVVEYITSIFEKYGLKNTPKKQKIKNVIIYPADYFCPMNYSTGQITITKNTRSIHHYTASWRNKKEQKQNEVLQKLNRKYGERIGYRLWRCYTLPYRIFNKIKSKGIKGTFFFLLKKMRGIYNG